jgi:hypothetical protein
MRKEDIDKDKIEKVGGREFRLCRIPDSRLLPQYSEDFVRFMCKSWMTGRQHPENL